MSIAYLAPKGLELEAVVAAAGLVSRVAEVAATVGAETFPFFGGGRRNPPPLGFAGERATSAPSL